MTAAVVMTIAGSDSGGGAGVQADLKAFAAAGCHGTSVIVALTAQNTHEVRAISETPLEMIRTQYEAVTADLDVAAIKCGMLFSAPIIGTVASLLREAAVPLVIDPVMIASSGAALLRADAVDALVQQLFPLATVVTPNLLEAQALTGAMTGDRRRLCESLVRMGARAALVTGGHGDPVDHLFDGAQHHSWPVTRHRRRATHGAGCTHSATLCALLAQGAGLRDAAVEASAVAAGAVAAGLEGIGAGDGPVDVLGISGREPAWQRS